MSTATRRCLWVLRDVLGMTGTKFGCGMALCGACTVHLDGQPIRSCVTPIDSVGDATITTIEAIGDDAGRQEDPAGLARPRSRPVRLLPVRPDHVGRGAAREQSRTDRRRHRRGDVAATSAAAAPMCASARRSSRRPRSPLPSPGRLTMLLDRLTLSDRDETAPRQRLAPRTFLRAGAAAGGGLLLSFSLPCAGLDGARPPQPRLRAQRFHPHRPRRPGHADHAPGRDGPGHLHLHADAGRRRTRGRPRQVQVEHAPPTTSSTPIRWSAFR